jgi:hypothetical protein
VCVWQVRGTVRRTAHDGSRVLLGEVEVATSTRLVATSRARVAGQLTPGARCARQMESAILEQRAIKSLAFRPVVYLYVLFATH